MIARASSGSRSSINSIEPLISANSAVTVLRSSSATVETVCLADAAILIVLSAPAGDCAAALPAASAVPQSAQNLASAGESAPHFGQRIGNGVPHSEQNRLSGKLSVPHFEQRIFPGPPSSISGSSTSFSL